MRAQLGIDVEMFPDPSLAIVKGATFFSRFELKKHIRMGFGMEVVKPIASIQDVKCQ